MMRNLIVLSCSALLAIALGVVSYAGSAIDSDSDGVLDPIDNCTDVPNGPLGGSCNAQQDGDSDGFGNSCDTDVNQDGATTIIDVSATLSQSKLASTALTYDFNCDGAVTLVDVAKALSDSKVPGGTQPGGSCGQPVGIPCP